MNLTLKIWRQKNAASPGRFETHEARDVSPDMSFLEMLDMVNERLIAGGQEPFVFDSDCREGIRHLLAGHQRRPPWWPQGTTACQLHMRISRTARPSPSNPGARGRFPRSRT